MMTVACEGSLDDDDADWPTKFESVAVEGGFFAPGQKRTKTSTIASATMQTVAMAAFRLRLAEKKEAARRK